MTGTRSQDPTCDTRWVQFDLTLRRDGPGPASHAHASLRSVAAAAPGQAWFFQRKVPDIRLRVAVDESTVESTVVAVEEALTHAIAEGHLRSAEPGTYDAEVERFGGTAAMAIAHRHFCRDAALWLAEGRSLRGPLDDDTASMLVTPLQVRSWLSRRITEAVLPDPADRADVWRRWRRLSGPPPVRSADDADAGADLRAAIPAPLAQRAAELERALAADTTADTACGSATDIRPATAPLPPTQVSAWLALVHHFDANRWGVAGPDQARIAEHHRTHDVW